MRTTPMLLLLLLCAAPSMAEEGKNPHHMMTADGDLDMNACHACHQDDMSLNLSKGKICTRCHSQTTHGGSVEHLRAPAAAVKRVAPAEGDALPLTEDGQIYCGTCHLFHDPNVMGETPLEAPYLPSAAGLAEAVRASQRKHWTRIAEKYEEGEPQAKFVQQGTKELRLPIADGALCLHCHQDVK